MYSLKVMRIYKQIVCTLKMTHLSVYNSLAIYHKWDIFTSANFAKQFFVLEENFAKQEFTIYLHIYSCLGTDTFARQKASHEISYT